MRFVKHRYWPLAIALSIALSQQAHAAPILKANDRVVIYGDSITEQRQYSRYIQQYIYCRYPELKVKFFNAGWGGDTAPGGAGRLERDVLSLNPTVVTLFFGMNDGGYRKTDQAITERYRTGTENIIKALQAKGVRVVVFTPGAVDYDKRPNLRDADYNTNLAALGDAGKELAAKYNLPFWNVIQPMVDFQNAQKAKNPQFTMIPDAVHPNAPGHLVMAHQMLQGLGAEPMPPLGTIDLAANQMQGVRVVTRNNAQLVLETTAPSHVPFWFSDSSTAVMRDSGFLNFAGQKLTVRGLAPGTYRLTIDGANAGQFSAEELAAGASIPGAYSARGKRIHDLAEMKENNYFNAWRNVRLPLGDTPGAKQVVDSLLAADEGYHQMIHSFSEPLPKVTLTLNIAPGGPNLALKKKYEVSDPNLYNWGIGGLTDGSWEMKSPNTFASGDKTTYPKHVTIDLEKPERIGMVTLGVPNFGSTRTIKVAVSNDGTTFTEVGTHEFALRTEARHTYAFPPVEARYVRVIYPDSHNEQVNYPTTFAFTTEVEVYPPGQGAIGAAR